MRKHLLAAAAMLAMAALDPLFAQTASEQKLAEAIGLYNEYANWAGDFTDANTTAEVVEKAKRDAERPFQLLREVQRDAAADVAVKRVARYFEANLTEKTGFIIGASGRNQEALDLLRTVEADMAAYSAADFPMRYSAGGKKYVIEYLDNFAAAQATYFGVLADLYSFTGNQAEAKKCYQKSLDLPRSTPFIRYVATSKLISMKEDAREHDAELARLALAALRNWPDLAEAEVANIKDRNSKTPKSFYRALETAVAKDRAAARGGAAFAEAAPLLGGAGEAKLEEDATQRALEMGHGDLAFARSAMAMAKRKKPASAMFNQLAGNCFARNMAVSDCAQKDELAGFYQSAGMAKEAANQSAQAEKCRRQAEKAARKASRGRTSLFVGLCGFPLMTRYNHYRDYGPVLNIRGRRNGLELGYMPVNKNAQLYFDMAFRNINTSDLDPVPFWNGSYTHAAYKRFRRDSDEGRFSGFIAGMADMEFEEMTVNVSQPDGTFLGQLDFRPEQKQYFLMYNFGMQVLPRRFGLAFEMYMSVGGNYNQWKLGNEQAEAQPELLIAHPILEHRKKSFFMPMVRFGFNIGLATGRP